MRILRCRYALIAALCAGFTLGLTACTDERARTGAAYTAGVAAFEGGDYATALRELRPSAEQGDAHAQAVLGMIYLLGGGVPQDHAEAAKWYRKAAEQGHVGAQRLLGHMYERGLGVTQDYVQDHIWYNFAASSPPSERDDRAITPRDHAYTGLNRVAPKMTPAQIAEAEKLAREWKPKK